MIDSKLSPLIRLGVAEEDILKFDVLCLPENIEGPAQGDQLYDSDSSITLSKLVKAENIRCANSLDLGLETKFLERRGALIWLGTIWILNTVIVPLLVNILATKLFGRKTGKSSGSNTPPDKPLAVRVNILLRKDGEFSSIKYEGDSEVLLRLLAATENNPDDK
ncbi:MAG: hypothetical protein BIFFINMI_02502 [Phycisphaerae bacterium]|nr:hypothetical protein [Phycisphaerae bacterium]